MQHRDLHSTGRHRLLDWLQIWSHSCINSTSHWFWEQKQVPLPYHMLQQGLRSSARVRGGLVAVPSPNFGGTKIVTVNVCTFISDMHCVRRNQATGDRWTHQMASLQSVPVKSKPRSSMLRRKSLKKTTQCLATASCDFLAHKYRNPSSELTNNIPNMNWFYFKGYLTFCFVLVGI